MELQEVRKTYSDWAPIYDATHAWTLPYRREARLALGPLARAIHGMHVCRVDITHRTIDEMRRVFANVQIRERWAGFVFIAVGTTGE